MMLAFILQRLCRFVVDSGVAAKCVLRGCREVVLAAVAHFILPSDSRPRVATIQYLCLSR